MIAPDDMKNAEKELAKRGREYAEYLSRMPVEERVFLEKYMDVSSDQLSAILAIVEAYLRTYKKPV